MNFDKNGAKFTKKEKYKYIKNNKYVVLFIY